MSSYLKPMSSDFSWLLPVYETTLDSILKILGVQYGFEFILAKNFSWICIRK